MRLSFKLMVAALLLSGVLRAAYAEPAWKCRPRRLLYRLKPGIGAAEHEALLRRFGAASVACRHHSHHELTLPPGQDEKAAAAALMATGAVEFAEPDRLAEPAVLPNDPNYSSQWHHALINTPRAWDVTTGASSIVVGICDSGVDASHPDLAGRVLSGYNSADGSTNTAPVASHGTEVAGVVAAAGNNGVGVAGMGWGLQILPVRITNNPDTSAFCSDMASGIEWAADHGAKVVNLSYNTVVCPSTIDAAAQYAYTRGTLVVVAAGNASQDISSLVPTSHTFMMVGGTDASDKLSWFSNYGTPIDVTAPSVQIMTTSPGGGYFAPNGTSFAAPIVTGLAALLYSVNPGFSINQVKNFISSTATDLGAPGKDTFFGAGRVNAGLAVDTAKSFLIGNRAPVVNAGIDRTIVWPSSTTLSGTVSDDRLPSPPGSPTLRWSKLSGPGDVIFGDAGSATTSAVFSLAGTYQVQLAADDGLLIGSRSLTVTVKPGPNGEGGLPTPTLNLPPQLPLQSMVSVGYPSNIAITGFKWSVRPAAAASAGSKAAPSVTSAPSASWATPGTVASIGGQHLPAGYYQISVQAYMDSGILSPSAQTYVTFLQSGLDDFRVFPNPWRSDRHRGYPITFDRLTPNTKIRIFTVAGQLVRTLTGNDPIQWDLKNDAGDQVASGLYLYLATNDEDQKAHGKLAIIH